MGQSSNNRSALSDFVEKVNRAMTSTRQDEVSLVREGQYQNAIDDMKIAHDAGIPVGLVGPVGSGKTLLCRYFAQEFNKPFYWTTFTDLVRPTHLIGAFDPVTVFQKGHTAEAFIPGPLTNAVIDGGLFLANEVNRADEYVLNVFLDPLEERTLEIPQLKKRVRVHNDFYLVTAMNPSEYKGTRKLSQAFKSRIGVWIHLEYPPKDLEMKILRHNVQDLTIPDEALEGILKLITIIRRDRSVERPPSLRAAISMARFIAIELQQKKKSYTRPILKHVAMIVLPEAIVLESIEEDPRNYTKKVLDRV